MPAFEQVPVTELPDDFTNETDRLLLDIREPDEWQEGHIRGALHIPLGQVPERIDEIDPDVDLYVICRTSGRSFRMLEYFEHVGREGIIVEGGMVAWEAGGKPVVTGDEG
ncbi:rhodanese-like domain-containing protein [Gordonia crocea]|uniref:Sulfurtransferase n=1 Tax=Gordonia crocea TaxID=589162 RepID=A0A7M3SUF2_9ACTN|nr:rhodanese-like domain-containing protein [Gordonia crocea]GED96276.1 sulfurtransferase [Gordonia crocea]